MTEYDFIFVVSFFEDANCHRCKSQEWNSSVALFARIRRISVELKLDARDTLHGLLITTMC